MFVLASWDLKVLTAIQSYSILRARASVDQLALQPGIFSCGLFYTHTSSLPTANTRQWSIEIYLRSALQCYCLCLMDFPQTERTTLKRLPKRGVYDREIVYGILDEGFICHVGFTVEVSLSYSTGYARVDDQLYIHGSQVSRMLRTLSGASTSASR